MLPTYARADITIVRGEGCRVWDDAGREYLDFVAGIAVVGLGHCAPAPLAAAHEQLDRLWHASNLYWTEPMLRLAALLAERFAGGRAFFCNSGAEANEAALKIARKATGRTRIVALEGGFHGRTLGALSATGQPSKWEGFGPLVPGISFARPNDVESLEAALAPAGDTALLLLEPVLGEGGVIPLEPAFAQAAAELALEVGALLCVDEVQAGMGRTGTFFAHEQLGITPDLVTLAKGLGKWAAHRRAARRRAGRARLRPRRPRLDVRRQSGRRCRRRAPSSRRSTTSCLGHVRRARRPARGRPRARFPPCASVRGRGLLIGAELDRPVGPVVDACREQGLLVLSAGPDVLRLTPPLVVSAAEVEQALAILEAVLAS